MVPMVMTMRFQLDRCVCCGPVVFFMVLRNQPWYRFGSWEPWQGAGALPIPFHGTEKPAAAYTTQPRHFLPPPPPNPLVLTWPALLPQSSHLPHPLVTPCSLISAYSSWAHLGRFAPHSSPSRSLVTPCSLISGDYAPYIFQRELALTLFSLLTSMPHSLTSLAA